MGNMKDTQVFSIIDKESGKFIQTPTGKVGWKKSNHAKSAFNLRNDTKYADQDQYEIVEVSAECNTKLSEIRSLVHEFYHGNSVTNSADILQQIKDLTDAM